MKITLDPPRWPGGPPICPAANLPCFDSAKGAAEFRETNSPGCTVIEQWTCTACGLIHFWGVASCPSGASSGTTRLAKHIDSIREAFLKSKVARTIPRAATTTQ